MIFKLSVCIYFYFYYFFFEFEHKSGERSYKDSITGDCVASLVLLGLLSLFYFIFYILLVARPLSSRSFCWPVCSSSLALPLLLGLHSNGSLRGECLAGKNTHPERQANEEANMRES